MIHLAAFDFPLIKSDYIFDDLFTGDDGENVNHAHMMLPVQAYGGVVLSIEEINH